MRAARLVKDLPGNHRAQFAETESVILVLVDQTEGHHLVDLCRDRASRERELLTNLADVFNIFSVVGPESHVKNLVFRA